MDDLLQSLIRQFRSQLAPDILHALELLRQAFEHMTRTGDSSNRYRNELLNATAILIEEALERNPPDAATAQRLATNIRRAGLQEAHAALLALAERVGTDRAAEGASLRVLLRRVRDFTFLVIRERGGDLPTGRVAVFDTQGRLRSFENFTIGDKESARRAAGATARRLRIPATIITGVLGSAFLLFFAAEIVGSIRS